jgi:diguanylate cyclase (GGDEF)-like protein
MDTISEARARAEATINAYDSVLLTLQRTASAISGEENPVFKARLSDIRSEIQPTASTNRIEQSGVAVTKELVEFSKQQAYVREKNDWALKQVTGIAARILVATAQNGTSQGQELAELATRLSAVSHLQNLDEVRQALVCRVEEINAVAERVQEEAKAQTLAMERELGRVKKRLAVLEQLSETDALTGLGNRRMAENAIRTSLDSQVPMSIVMLDLNGFKAINDTHGHRRGDQVLQLVARELRRSVPDCDVICRWGGDEFVLVLRNADKTVAKAKAAAIQRNLSGEFLVDNAGEAYKVDISASIGVAEYQEGEDTFEFFERADQLMYAEKSRNRIQTGTLVQ